MLANGELKTTKRGDKDFEYYIMNFGMLGVVLSMTWDVVPAYRILKTIYNNLSWDVMFPKYDQIMGYGHFMSFFIKWDKPEMNSVWISRVLKDGQVMATDQTFHGAKLVH